MEGLAKPSNERTGLARIQPETSDVKPTKPLQIWTYNIQNTDTSQIIVGFVYFLFEQFSLIGYAGTVALPLAYCNCKVAMLCMHCAWTKYTLIMSSSTIINWKNIPLAKQHCCWWLDWWLHRWNNFFLQTMKERSLVIVNLGVVQCGLKYDMVVSTLHHFF